MHIFYKHGLRLLKSFHYLYLTIFHLVKITGELCNEHNFQLFLQRIVSLVFIV